MKRDMKLADARQLANNLLASLAPACERIEIAGSIRRGNPGVGDIELVAIPKPGLDLFNAPTYQVTDLDGALARLILEERLALVKGGGRYKQFLLPAEGIALDLFVVLPPAQWGVIFAIRTGPSDFSTWLVTPRAKGGRLPSYLQVEDGAVWNGRKPMPTPEEKDFFDLLGLPYMEPGKRQPKWRIA